MVSPIITFLSDYGLADHFVGVCHAVIAAICPEARVIDLSHGVGRHDVRGGALVLADALDYLPVGIHLAVVDPDVGAQRRAVALRLGGGCVLVGPDNGLLSLAAARGGGVAEAVDLDRSRFRRDPVSATFHGRDLFAPVAARLAAGAPLTQAGEPCDAGTLVALTLPRPRREGDALVAHALTIDRFGNVALGLFDDELAACGLARGHPVELRTPAGAVHEAQLARTFADVAPGALLLYEDSNRRLAVAVAHGDAASLLGVAIDDEVWIRPA